MERGPRMLVFVGLGVVLVSCGRQSGPVSPGNQPSILISGQTECHPHGPGSRPGALPCLAGLRAAAADPRGDVVTFRWSGCASGTGASADCIVGQPRAYAAEVTATDSRGATSRALVTVTGTNRAPQVAFGGDRPPSPASPSRRYVIAGGELSDPDGDERPAALCDRMTLSSSGPCQASQTCNRAQGTFDLTVDTLDRPGACELVVATKDSWDVQGRQVLRFDVGSPQGGGAGNHPPTVTLTGGGSCHPSAPGSERGARPCTVAFQAHADDADGDALTFTWSGCAQGAGASSRCTITQPGDVTATVTVDDGRGGVASASAQAAGTNDPPEVRFGYPRPPNPLAANTLYSINGGQPTDPDGDEDSNDLCDRLTLTATGPCDAGVFWCGGVGDAFDIDIRTLEGPGTCELVARTRDSWGLPGEARLRYEVNAP